MLGASRLTCQSSAQTDLPWPCAAATLRFPFRGSRTSANWQRADATLPTQILSPDSPLRQAAMPLPPFSPCPARRPSAPALRFPVRASSAETKARPGQATLHPTTPDPVARGEAPLVPLRPNLPRRCDTWPPALSATRISGASSRAERSDLPPDPMVHWRYLHSVSEANHQRSTSPSTMSIEPRMAIRSAMSTP